MFDIIKQAESEGIIFSQKDLAKLKAEVTKRRNIGGLGMGHTFSQILSGEIPLADLAEWIRENIGR